MRHINKITYCLMVFCLMVDSLNAQTVLPPSRMEVYMQLSNNDSSIVFDDTLFSSHSILDGTVYIKLQDTLNLSIIHVKLGTTQGGSDIFNKDFVFDEAGDFTDNTWYLREGLDVMLGIGEFIGLNSYFSEVRLEDTSQNLSDTVYYNHN